MIKKSIILFLALAIVLTAAGCGLANRGKEKMAQKITGGILEKVIGDGTKVDISDGGLTIKSQDDDGEDMEINFSVDDEQLTIESGDGSLNIGSGEWPSGRAADLLPKLNEGKLAFVMNTEDFVNLQFEGIDKKTFENYLNEIKNKGFTENTTTVNSEGYFSYSASTAQEDASISLGYGTEDGVLQITVTHSEE